MPPRAGNGVKAAAGAAGGARIRARNAPVPNRGIVIRMPPVRAREAFGAKTRAAEVAEEAADIVIRPDTVARIIRANQRIRGIAIRKPIVKQPAEIGVQAPVEAAGVRTARAPNATRPIRGIVMTPAAVRPQEAIGAPARIRTEAEAGVPRPHVRRTNALNRICTIALLRTRAKNRTGNGVKPPMASRIAAAIVPRVRHPTRGIVI